MTATKARRSATADAGERPYSPAQFATGPPHVRSVLSVPRVMRCLVIAVLPCVAAALYNTGYQANRVLSSMQAAPSDWRAPVLQLLGASQSPADSWGCIAHGALYFLPLFATSIAAGFAAERLFAQLRGRAPDHVVLPTVSLLFTLCLPPTLPLWQAALGCAVGVVVGKEIFGGFGRNIVNPPLTGLAFLYFTYPGSLSGTSVWVAVDGYSGATPLAAAAGGGLAGLSDAGFSWEQAFVGALPGSMGETSAAACLLGVAILLYTGIASWRVVAGGLIGLGLGVLIAGVAAVSRPMAALPWHWHVVTGGFAFGLVFLATDPITGAATNPGRWLYGVLIGALVVLIRVANPAHAEGVILAVLLGNVAAPLIDQIAARAQTRLGQLRNVP